MNTKASARDVVLIGVLIFALAIGLFAAHYMINSAVTQMTANPIINSSSGAVSALESTQELSNKMDYVVFGTFLAMCLALIITGYFIGGYPIFMFIYFLFIVISVIISAILANTWETVSQLTVFLSSIAHFTLTNHIILYLPRYMAIVGFVGILAMFAKPYMEGASQ